MPRDIADEHLHPVFRARLLSLEADILREGLPLKRFEGARTPFRQAQLFSQGRTIGDRGKPVTKARPWDSYHQYAMATDEVFWVNGSWTWEEPEAGMWEAYRKLAEDHSLRCLSFEKPHVEYPIPMEQLEAGAFPPDAGDDLWRDWLEEQVEQWGLEARIVNSLTMPGAPHALLNLRRPALPDPA
jgi:hypothetical protein